MGECLLAKYDQLVRTMNKILEFNCEPEFLRFVINQEECRQKWLSSVEECHRLSKELERSHKEIKEREIKLHHARRLLDQESKLRRKAESERDSLDHQLLKVKELLFSNPLNDETREKLAFLSTTTRPSVGRDPRLDTISEALNSTGSILSDLGYSRSEDDLDESITRGRWKFRRSSPNSKEQVNQNKRRRSDNMNQENQETKPVILTGKGMMATTSMSVSATGTIKTHSKIEAIPSPPKKAKVPCYEQSTPIPQSPKKSESLSTEDSLCQNNEAVTSPNVCGYVFGVNNKKMMTRTHEFITKTVLRPEACNPCGKKIKFGTVVLKCIDCRTSAHPACRNKVPLPCIAVANTPKVKDFNGVISDYTPRDAPMVPALIIHCINEIERRGLSDVGLYRVPGSDKEVKTLKERFLRGKGIPNLSDVDIHVICSTVKDFLRSLREPLVSPFLHDDFVKAVASTDDLETIRSNLYQVILELPQPNRDTLAYLILHLQRMSQNLECKMNISNLSKIFAITVIGVSNENVQQALMIEDIQRKIIIMEHLMMIPSEYWNSFVDVEPIPPTTFRTPLRPTKSASSMLGESLYLTPLLSNRVRRQGKFFNTPPSAKC